MNKPRNQKALCDLRAFPRSEKEKRFHKTFAAKNLTNGRDYYTDLRAEIEERRSKIQVSVSQSFERQMRIRLHFHVVSSVSRLHVRPHEKILYATL